MADTKDEQEEKSPSKVDATEDTTSEKEEKVSKVKSKESKAKATVKKVKNLQAAPVVAGKTEASAATVPAKRPDETKPATKASLNRWSKKVSQITSRALDNAAALVGLHHEVGIMANELRADPAHWGNHTIEELGSAIGWSKTSIQMSATFATRYPDKEEVKKLVQSGLTWKPFAWLSMIHEDHKRIEYQGHMVKKEKTQADLQDFVASLNNARRAKAAAAKGDKKPRQRGVSPNRVFKSTMKRCSDIMESVSAVRRAVDSYHDMVPGDKRKETTDTIKETVKTMRSAVDQLDTILDILDSIE